MRVAAVAACPRAPGRAHLEPQQQLAWPILPGPGGPSAGSEDARQAARARTGSGVLVPVPGQRCWARGCLLRAAAWPQSWVLLARGAAGCNCQQWDPNGQWAGPGGGAGPRAVPRWGRGGRPGGSAGAFWPALLWGSTGRRGVPRTPSLFPNLSIFTAAPCFVLSALLRGHPLFIA